MAVNAYIANVTLCKGLRDFRMFKVYDPKGDIYNNMTTAEIQNCAKSPPERYTDIYDFPKIFFVFLSMSPRRKRIYHSEN